MIHLLNNVWPNIFESSPHVVQAFMGAVEGMRVGLGASKILQYSLQVSNFAILLFLVWGYRNVDEFFQLLRYTDYIYVVATILLFNRKYEKATLSTLLPEIDLI